MTRFGTIVVQTPFNPATRCFLTIANDDSPASFQKFSQTCDRIKATRSKIEKVRILSEYLANLKEDKDLKIAVTFLSGRTFPPGEVEQDTNVGYSTLWDVISEITDSKDIELSKYYRKYGDLGSALEDIISEKISKIKTTGQLQLGQTLFQQKSLTVQDVCGRFVEISKCMGSGSQIRKQQILKGLFSNITIPSEAKYIVKILTNEMRIGLVEGLVEESLAKAFSRTLQEVRMANLIVANLGIVAILARYGKLSEAKLAPLRPTNYMLADNAETAEALFTKFKEPPMYSEYKYDGIRAQVHLLNSEVKIFSRNLADITRFFPEIEDAAKMIKENDSFILDGEIIAYRGKPLSFQLLQRRLRKISRSDNDAPIKYLAFDLLYSNGSPLIQEPLEKRVQMLRRLTFEDGTMGFSEQRAVSSAQEISDMFIESKSLGYEGLVVKDRFSPYTPGRRGSNWVKLKKELDTLDVVIVACEYGHGKRAGVISDYTFAVSDGPQLKVVGKAYSGLSDKEIAEMTELMKSLTIEDQGYRGIVRPQVVIEVAFDAIQKSNRHDSGYALRFPRIKRIRDDKSLSDIDSLERVKGIYENQQVKA
jgi:DNA ligase-1